MYKELFQISEKCYSSVHNINFVLTEVIHSIEKLFPEHEARFLLSYDEKVDKNLPVKNLEFHCDHPAAISAFVDSSIKIVKNPVPFLFAPLRGKQGVYGVLYIKSSVFSPFQENQLTFIQSIANMVGNVIEISKSYQQSQILIENLRLIDEITQKLNSMSSYEEMMNYLTEQIFKIFDSDTIAFVSIDEREPRVWRESSSFFHSSEGKKILQMITNKLLQEEEHLLLGEVHHLLPEKEVNNGSLMAVPYQVNKEKGFMAIIHNKTYFYTFEKFRLFQSLVQRASLGIANIILREKLEKMVITDYLTGLYARNYLDSAIEKSQMFDREGTFILIDLDDFKEINDRYGHLIGDQVLIQVAKLIKRSIRPSDIAARWGGEELAVYLPGVPLEQGVKVAERLLEVVSNQTNPKVTLSCGISNWKSDIREGVSDLFNRADSALYRAKNSGKNKIIINAV